MLRYTVHYSTLLYSTIRYDTIRYDTTTTCHILRQPVTLIMMTSMCDSRTLKTAILLKLPSVTEARQVEKYRLLSDSDRIELASLEATRTMHCVDLDVDLVDVDLDVTLLTLTLLTLEKDVFPVCGCFPAGGLDLRKLCCLNSSIL